jgi:DNA primase
MPKESRFVDFRAVKSAVTMEQVLAHYGILDRFKRGQDSLSGPCPIHQGSNPTQFRVCPSKNCWNCFSECKCGGNVLDFVAKMENVEPMVAANRLVEWFNLNRDELNADAPESKSARHERPEGRPRLPERRTSQVPASTAHAASAQPPASAAKPPAKEETGSNPPLKFRLELDAKHPYIAERGLTAETVKKFGVGYCGRGVMSGRIAIPIHNAQGELVGYVGRWAGTPPGNSPKYRLPDGFKKSVEVFNLARAMQEPKEQPLILVEGFFDVMKLWQLGYRKTVALMGCSMSAAQAALLTAHLTPGSHVIVMFDEDDAGRAGREDVLRRLALRAYVRVVTFAEEDQQPEHLSADEARLLQLGVTP